MAQDAEARLATQRIIIGGNEAGFPALTGKPAPTDLFNINLTYIIFLSGPSDCDIKYRKFYITPSIGKFNNVNEIISDYFITAFFRRTDMDVGFLHTHQTTPSEKPYCFKCYGAAAVKKIFNRELSLKYGRLFSAVIDTNQVGLYYTDNPYATGETKFPYNYQNR